jgi:hypothetical protein
MFRRLIVGGSFYKGIHDVGIVGLAAAVDVAVVVGVDNVGVEGGVATTDVLSGNVAGSDYQ